MTLDRVLERIQTLTLPSNRSSITSNSTVSRPSRYSSSSRNSTPSRRSSSNSSRASLSSILDSTYDTYGTYKGRSSQYSSSSRNPTQSRRSSSNSSRASHENVYRLNRVANSLSEDKPMNRKIFNEIQAIDSIASNHSLHHPDATRLQGLLEKRAELYNTLGANEYAYLAGITNPSIGERHMTGYI